MKLADILTRLRAGLMTPAVRLAAVYLAGLLILVAGYVAGVVGPIFRAGGWVAYAVCAVAALHAIGAFRTTAAVARTGDCTRAEAGVAWLEKADGVILGLGFLGKLFGIATALTAIGGTSDPAAALASIATISQTIGAALFSTMAGLAVALWTHCGTLIVSNYVEAEKDNPLNVAAKVLSREEWELEDRRIQAMHHMMDHGSACCGQPGPDTQGIVDAVFTEVGIPKDKE